MSVVLCVGWLRRSSRERVWKIPLMQKEAVEPVGRLICRWATPLHKPVYPESVNWGPQPNHDYLDCQYRRKLSFWLQNFISVEIVVAGGSCLSDVMCIICFKFNFGKFYMGIWVVNQQFSDALVWSIAKYLRILYQYGRLGLSQIYEN